MGKNVKTGAELIREGWTSRFIANEPRLSEAAQLYRSMGYEVHPEALPAVDLDSAPEESAECTACFKGFEDHYRIIHTRPRKGKSREDNPSFFRTIRQFHC